MARATPTTNKNKRDSCSVCDATNYRNCSCPWNLPFDDWGREHPKLLAKVVEMVSEGSGER